MIIYKQSFITLLFRPYQILVVTSSNGAQDLVVDVEDQQQIKEELSRIHSPPTPGSPSQHQLVQQQHNANNGDIKGSAMFSTQVRRKVKC